MFKTIVAWFIGIVTGVILSMMGPENSAGFPGFVLTILSLTVVYVTARD